MPKADAHIIRFRRLVLAPGTRFAKLVVLGDAPPHISPSGIIRRMVRVKCDCGTQAIVNLSNLMRGNTKSCGCLKHVSRPGKKTYKVGMRFGRLTAIAEAGSHTSLGGHKVRRMRFRCDCGNQCEYAIADVSRGHIKSCGCYHREAAGERRRLSAPHGHARDSGVSREYRTWSSMIQRCTNPKQTKFSYYGGRGIRVCERWMKFENFLADMGSRPKGRSIDRIDNNGNYEPGNCRWATPKEQTANQRPYPKNRKNRNRK